MARWARPAHWPEVPTRLLVFDETDWRPDSDPQEQWKDARRDWCRQHGFSQPGEPYGVRLPDGPLGDVIDQINAERATRRVWP